MSWFSEKRNGGKAAARLSAPLARTDELIVEDFSDEVLIYDQRNDQAHCLSREAAMVWRVCDGRTSSADLAAALDLNPAVVASAIEELEACDLLDSPPAAGITRREVSVRLAKVGGAAAAAPMIYSILAPTPALASSQQFCLNLNNAQCFTNGAGCATCFKAGCVCCGAGSSGGSGAKLCTADCTCTFCNAAIIHSHCGVCDNQSTCTAGPSKTATNFKCTGTGQTC